MVLRLMNATYDTIGVNYSNLRKPDPRIEQVIWQALGSAKTVLNVGAGAGSYEPPDREVTALEPSIEMICQRSSSSGNAVQGTSEALPFADNTFDASMAILTVHHWQDKAKGMAEMRRVTRGPVVFLTFDPSLRGFWLEDYLPELAGLDDVIMPQMGEYEKNLGPVDISAVPVPHDCVDGFLCAYWRRPHAYLDPKITAAMSPFWTIENVAQGFAKLEANLKSGEWEKRYYKLLELESYDAGYRLVVTKE